MHRLAFLAVTLAFTAGSYASAQATTQDRPAPSLPDTLEGRIGIADVSKPIDGAHVVLKSLETGAIRTNVSDGVGHYHVEFPPGDGEYELRVTAIGYAPYTTHLARRLPRGSVVYAMDIHLRSVTPQLAAVQIKASRRRKASLRDYATDDIGGHADEVGEFGMSAADAGDLTAAAVSVPGVTLVPNPNGGPPGFSVLGTGPTQNAVTLNGLNFGGSQLPSAAYTSTRLQTSAYDPSVGGFSGGLLATTLLPGTNYTFDFVTATLDDPSLQLTDPAGTRFGQRSRNIIVSGARRGPLVRDRLFYNVSGQLGRRTNPLPSLLAGNPEALTSLGVSPAAVQALLASLDSVGVPAGATTALGQTTAQSASVLGRFDIAPSASRILNIVAGGNWRRTRPTRVGPTALPSVGGSLTDWGGNVQGEFGRYIQDFYVARVRSGLSLSGTDGRPFSTLPEGQVLVGSELPNGDQGLTTLSFGGANAFPSHLRKATWETIVETSWFLPANSHRPKIAGALRIDAYQQNDERNRAGLFSFQSLADLAANRPSAFVRTLRGGEWSAHEASVWWSAGDLWRVTDRIALQYGVRWEGNRFGSGPATNRLVDSTLGVANTSVPNTMHVSPRFGFTWAYGNASRVSASARPRGQFRGGIGEFRSVLAPSIVGPALSGTGLPGAVERVACIGLAAPTPDWTAYAATAAAVPTTCGDQTTGFVDSRSPVTLLAPGYEPSRAWRGTLGWTGPFLNMLRLSLDATYSLNLHQPGVSDLNFAGVPKFTLGDERRPVFVDPTRIDPVTGGADPTASRKVAALSSVTALRSDLRSNARLLSVRVGPNGGFFATRFWNVGYTYAHNRDESRGFDGAAFGDPRIVSWSNSSTDIRHTFSGSFSTRLGDDAFLGISGQIRSGAPYTPLVQGDVNGDGLAGNDRAFIFDRGAVADTAVANGMSRLLASAPSGARTCLATQQGRPSARNSCRGPWTTFVWLQGSVSGRLVHLPARSEIGFTISNPLTGIDYLVHGQTHLHGWGQPSIPDPTLLVVKGFDPDAQRFRYAVNPAFGATRPGLGAFRAPFQVTLSVTVPLNAPYGHQQLDDAIGPGRYRKGERLTADEIKQIYSRFNFYDPISPLLAARDSLLLTREQAAALTAIGKVYYTATDSIWTALATDLARVDSVHYDRANALREVRAAKGAAYDALERAAVAVRGTLTPDQLAIVAPELQQMLDPKTLAKMRRNELQTYAP